MFFTELKFAIDSYFLPIFNDFSTISAHCCGFLQSTNFQMENCGNRTTFRRHHTEPCSVLREQQPHDKFCPRKMEIIVEPARFYKPPKPLLIAIEGNIGSGKSTLLKHLAKDENVDVMMEPVEDWCNVKGKNMLDLLYSNPRRWGYAFNSNAMLARMKMHCDTTSRRPIRIMERSLYATHHVFVEESFQAGNISEIERAVLDELFHTLCQYCNVKLDRIVYLRATPEVCVERIKKRGRKEEAGLSYEFITSLHNLYDEWLLVPAKSDGIPIVTIDATRDMRDRFPEIVQAVFEEPYSLKA